MTNRRSRSRGGATAWAGLAALLLLSGLATAQGPLKPRKPPPVRTSSTTPMRHLTGLLVSMLPDQIEIETEGGRRVTCRVDRATQFGVPADDFVPGDRLAISTLSPSDEDCLAFWVGEPEQRFRNPEIAERRAPAPYGRPAPEVWGEEAPIEGVSRPTSPRETSVDSDDPGPPVLRRTGAGEKLERRRPAPEPQPKSVPSRESRNPPAYESAEQRPPKPATSRAEELGRYEEQQGLAAPEPEPLHADPLIALAIGANYDFGIELPNFVCHQSTNRSISRNLGKKWKKRDLVEADVLLVDGVEHYSDITLDGVRIGAARMKDVGGAWSTGEFAAILWNIFAPPSRAEFTHHADEEIRGRQASIYDYKIEQPRSNWTLDFGGQIYLPAHHGQVWIEKETGLALRLQMEASYLPGSFPVISAETSIDVDDVEIDGIEYLLPIEATNLSCIRGSAQCLKNEIQFTDHRKFSVSSSVFTTESEIDFGGEAPEGDPAAEPPAEPAVEPKP